MDVWMASAEWLYTYAVPLTYCFAKFYWSNYYMEFPVVLELTMEVKMFL